ncbi:hypothetical protein Tco_1012077 [Tanacetum coccineum]
MDLTKVEVFKKREAPRNPTEICQFLDWWVTIDGSLKTFPRLYVNAGKQSYCLRFEATQKDKKNYTMDDLELGALSLQHILDQKMLNMRHRRWIELLSNYDCELKYHPGKANTLSKKERKRNARLRNSLMQIRSFKFGLMELDIDEIGFRKLTIYEKSPLCWLEARDRQLTRLDIIQETVNKITTIKERLKKTWSRQKRYGDNHRKPLKFKSKIMYSMKAHDSL